MFCKMKTYAILLVTGLLLIRNAPVQAQDDQRPMTFEDVLKIKRVSEPQLSPDGKDVLFVVRKVDLDKDRYISHIWRVRTTGGDPAQMTAGEKGERSPRWSPDGKQFAFLANRDGKTQIWLMPRNGGEAQKLTSSETGVQNFEWSPDGKTIAYLAFPPEKMKSKSDVKVVDKTFRYAQLYAMNIDTKESQRLPQGSPAKVGHIREIEWSPDGQTIAFTASKTPKVQDWITSEIYTLPAAGGKASQLTENTVGEGGLRWSPDGRRLSFTAGATDKMEYFHPTRIFVIDLPKSAPRNILGDWPGHAHSHFWSADGKQVYFTATKGVNLNLYAVPSAGGRVKQVTDFAGVLGTPHYLAGRNLLTFTRQDPLHPSEVFFTPLANFNPKQLTEMNPQIDSLRLGSYETVRWKSKDGTEVEGILIKPSPYLQGRRFPLIVQIHGGPASAVRNTFPASWGYYSHVYAGNGYAVLQPNYRGSIGYGAKFMKENVGHYFEKDIEDILTGIDFLIDAGVANPDLLGVMGWSAGGHMTNWLVTHTDRFKAASSGAGVANWVSLYAQTDVQFTREHYLLAPPWKNMEYYIQKSPLTYVENAKTPTLILFGEADERIPMPQGKELYMGLKKNGVRTEFVLYPGEPHGLRKPKHQLDKMQREFAWFAKYIRGEGLWQEQKVLMPEDLVTLKNVSQPQLSPDGKTVVYVLRETNLKENKRQSDLYRISASGGKPVRLTRNPKNDTAPKWSPDGNQIAFLSNRDGDMQVYLMNPFLGEPDRLTNIKPGVSSFEWSPDGRQLVLVVRDSTTRAEKLDKKLKRDQKVVDQNLKMSHLWLVDAKNGKIRRLTRGNFTVSQPAWSPDNRQIAFVVRPTPKANDGWKSDIWLVNIETGKIDSLIVRDGSDTTPRWSPDGQSLAFVSRPGKSRVGYSDIYVVPATGGEPENLTQTIDLNPSLAAWANDGSRIYFGSGDRVFYRLFSISSSGGDLRTELGRENSVSNFSFDRAMNKAAFMKRNPQLPGEVAVANLASATQTQLTRVHDALKRKKLGATEIVRWKSFDGLEVEGLLIKPVGYQDGKKYPLMVSVHGGPSGVKTWTFQGLEQLFAGRGYALLLPNYRGSTFYGDKFMKLNHEDLGGGDFKDIMAGVDALIERGIADPEKLGIMGWSYGGYMTAWAVTQTDRFKAGADGAGITDWFSMYGQNDIPGYILDLMSATPWKDYDRLEKASPMTYVEQVVTPVLLLQGQNDNRVPPAQAREFYGALKRRGVPTQFVTFPRSGHGIREPKLQLERYRRTLAWFEKWVTGRKPLDPEEIIAAGSMADGKTRSK